MANNAQDMQDFESVQARLDEIVRDVFLGDQIDGPRPARFRFIDPFDGESCRLKNDAAFRQFGDVRRPAI